MHHPFSKAGWIWTTDPGDLRYAVRRFRGHFEVDSAQSAVCHVTADCRYILSLDGQLAGRGPARSDLRHTMYDTYEFDVTPGRHVIAVLVLAYKGDAAPIAEMHDRGALLVEIKSADGTVLLATGYEDRWRVHVDTAYRPTENPVGLAPWYSAGAGEIADGGLIPHGWEKPAFDDSPWEAPVRFREAYPYERPADWGDPGGRWRLMPRDIPFMREEPHAFAESEIFPFTVPANSRREVVLNAGTYANGYPILRVSGGKGAAIQIVYAEALTRDGVKGVRDVPGGDVVGLTDTYRPGGGAETYSPLHWRAFRFVKLVVETGENPVMISGFSYCMTGYPWNRRAEFNVADGPAELPNMMDVDFRTLERCTDETFMDCPYYEQIQYAGDTRLQALLSYVTTGDTRLGARAVRLFDWSRLPEGLTQCRYPASITTVIPPFSLIWILMVEDLWRYAPGEERTVRDCLSGCRGVLEWFARHLNADGVLGGKIPWWNFIDWIPGWPDGGPPTLQAALPCATLNLQYLAGIQAYIRMREGFGDSTEAGVWRSRAEALASAITSAFWDDQRQLLREAPDETHAFSRHAQAWGLITGVVPALAVDSVVESLHSDDSLAKTTYYHAFYVIEALAKIGRLEHLWTQWMAPWREALAMNLLTWPEHPEPTRSDCHAWSAWPTYAFLTHVLGVRPTAPGFAAHEIKPLRVEGWDTISGRFPLPAGMLDVAVEWREDGAAVSAVETKNDASGGE